jgi:hypothetical protein
MRESDRPDGLLVVQGGRLAAPDVKRIERAVKMEYCTVILAPESPDDD